MYILIPASKEFIKLNKLNPDKIIHEVEKEATEENWKEVYSKIKSKIKWYRR